MSLSEMMSSPDSELSQLREHILELFNTQLSDYSMQVKQSMVQLFHKGSFYLELRRETPQMPVVDERRLQGTLKMAQTHVHLFLTLMELLLEEICYCRQELQFFMLQSEQGTVDFELVSATLSTLRSLHKHLKDFDTRETRNLGPLQLDNQLTPGSGPVLRASALLCYKLPVEFDRLQSHAKSTTAHLVWSLAGGQGHEPSQFYEIQVQILHPSVGEQGQYERHLVQNLSCTLGNLTPDRFYQFSVKRMDSINLVYGVWTDSLILKTSEEK